MYLAGFVLGDFVLGVLLALFALAIGATGLWDVDLAEFYILAIRTCRRRGEML